MVNLPTKFGVSTFSHYGDMKCVKNAQNGVVRGHPRSSAMSPFDRTRTISHLSLVETMYLPCTVFEIRQVICGNSHFDLTHLHLAPPLGVTPVEFQKDFWHQKTRVTGLLCAVVCMFLCLAILVEHWLVTDRQAHRRTNDHGIYRTEHSWRGKKQHLQNRRSHHTVAAKYVKLLQKSSKQENLEMTKCLNQRNNNEFIFLSNQLQLFNFTWTAHTVVNNQNQTLCIR